MLQRKLLGIRGLRCFRFSPAFETQEISLAEFVRFFSIAALLFASISSGPGAALAQSGNFGLELNNAVDGDDGSCRLVYVATNNTGVGLSKTAYEVAVFDGEGVVSQLLVLEFGALPVGKTKVVQFELPGQNCSNISKIIVNSLADCESEGGKKLDFCMKGLITNSRNVIEFSS